MKLLESACLGHFLPRLELRNTLRELSCFSRTGVDQRGIIHGDCDMRALKPKVENDAQGDRDQSSCRRDGYAFTVRKGGHEMRGNSSRRHRVPG